LQEYAFIYINDRRYERVHIISAMPEYKTKSQEELPRFEVYCAVASPASEPVPVSPLASFGGGSVSFTPSFGTGARQAEERSLNLRFEVRATAKAAAYDQLEERLVRSAVAESSAQVQE
jgi:hypothetical protein